MTCTMLILIPPVVSFPRLLYLTYPVSVILLN
uniref:Uncharacterized protein n=1 Tax=Anguilla anguilla TaxID=7936 RepID=A0A0E9UF51_ANGAN